MSTIDLIVIFDDPITGETKADVYDWKFTNFDKSTNEDIPFYKQDEWKLQMGEYSKIMYSYGLTPNQLRRARMIPFVATYRNAIPGDNQSKLILSGVEVGKFDNLKETKEATGDSFRDLTRIAKINEVMWSELFLENKEALVSKINDFMKELIHTKELILCDDKEALMSYLKEAKEKRKTFDIH